MNTNLIGRNSHAQFDYLVVGAGFFGAVVARRIATELGKKVLLIDKRNHLGGNCHSQIDEETGTEYHTYGTHIFHTNSKKVWDYLSQYTEWNNYKHQVLTTHKEKVYQMPISLFLINSFYNLNLKPFELEKFLEKKRVKISNPQSFEEKALSLIGSELYEAFLKGYTIKQWHQDPKDLPASILSRLPVTSSYDHTYFKHARYEGIPLNGFSSLFNKIVDHENITIKLKTDYFENLADLSFKEMCIYSGPLDELFNFEFGKLEWRGVSFEKKVLPYSDYQGTSVMNFADIEIPYTRVHEPHHLHPERKKNGEKSLVFYEFSEINSVNSFYPIMHESNQRRYAEYFEKLKNYPHYKVGGRLGLYSYLDMDQVVSAALAMSLEY